MQDVQQLTAPRYSARQRTTTVSSSLLISVVLITTMLIGGYFRFVGLNWDDFTHLHPDERFLTDVVQGLGRQLNPSGGELQRAEQISYCLATYPDTGGKGTFFDARCSPWNPLNANSSHGLYVYGTLPLFIARGAAELVAGGTEWYAQNVLSQPDYDGGHWMTYDGIHLVWRAISALAEMSIIVLVYLIGTKLHDKWVGLLAAVLYTGVVFSIQLAHFATVDSLSNFFTALAILFAVLVQREGKLINYAMFGVMVGAAVACRINLAPLAGLIVIAAAIQIMPALDDKTADRERRHVWTINLIGLVISGICAFLVFRFANPYTFTGPGFFGLMPYDRWLDNMGTASALNNGSIDSPPNFQWVARAPYLFPLNNMILWGMGVPLGIAVWIAWAVAGYRIVRGKAGALANILLFVWILIYFGWMGRNWVTTMRYFIPLYPSLVVLASWGLLALWRSAKGRRRALVGVVIGATAAFTLLWAAMFTNIYRNMLTRVQASYWVWENVPGDFAMRIETADGTPAPLLNISINNAQYGTGNDDLLLNRVTRFSENFTTASYEFTADGTGTVTSIHAPHLGDPLDDPEPEVLAFEITDQQGTVLARARLDSDLPRTEHIVGSAYDIPLDTAFTVTEGEKYTFRVTLESGGQVVSGGSILTWEGSWDDPFPVGTCNLPPGVTLADNPPPGQIMDARDCRRLDPGWGLLSGYQQDIVYEDEEIKRTNVLRTLNNSDYIVINSNRFYDTLSRNPARWPWTNFYYDKLFSGELGYDLEAVFQETYELGPLRVSDQYLPFYDAPEWLNEFEAEEAFHVYDHPVVMIFHKRADYDAQAVTDLLYSVPMTRTTTWNQNCPDLGWGYCDPTITNIAAVESLKIDSTPTLYEFPDDMAQVQRDGGTWSDRFDSASPINTSPVIGIVVWWLTIVLFGWLTFPLLFALLPGLADRGFALAKFAGIFLVAWGTWFISSLSIPVWSQIGIFAGLLIVAALGLAVAWRVRADLVTYLREHWGRLAIIELVTLAAFGLFLFIRLTNPDLWHPSFGGEKPMDFAYFNGVLRSTVFPPIDPWYAGGYINYYYFGYVIVGAPVLLLGMIPSIAYNLILPTLFATTGIAAFSAAFNVVSRLNWKRANPYVAGIAALVFCVLFGNLDTPRVFLSGVAQMGGYTRPQGMEQFLVQEYTTQTGVPPDQLALDDIRQRVDGGNIVDRLRYELDTTVDLLTSIGAGMSKLVNGQPLSVGAERWFWGPSRVLGETPGVEGQAITEMPMFTFVYGDLHAHMISMPMQLILIGLLLNEVLLAGVDSRARLARVLAILLIGALVGMLRATNTWDWITYIILGTVGLGLAWWLAWKRVTRRSLIDAGWRIGGFLAASFIAVAPYAHWFATSYSSLQFWQDGKTPLWGYFDIHGLFIFLLVTLLIWDTGRWFRSVRVRALRGMWTWIIAGFLLLALILLVALAATLVEYQVAIIAVPLLIWIAALLLRPDQTRPMQYVLLISGLAVGLTLGVEIFVLDGDIGRQNTIFKFYMQAWLIFAVMGGAAVAWLFASLDNWRPALRNVWTVGFAVLVTAAAMFPVMASQGKSVFRFDTEQPFTLDGAEFMNYGSQWEGDDMVIAMQPDVVPFSLADDYRLIRWMQENIDGSPTIVEGLADSTQYRWNARISIYTGLPAVLGWHFHQWQQRTAEWTRQFVDKRYANIVAFYNTDSVDSAWQFLQYYNVEYVVVGNLERAYYRAERLAKFDRMVEMGLLEVVYQEGDTTLYRVNHDAQLREVG
ncbi:MAG: glycosyltransferase family 39 protein [Anaerolinea sp.]|nr:glycosyltransferase family 39 protein [Anaerolinea sp.]